MNLFDQYEHQFQRLGSQADAKGVPVPTNDIGEGSPIGPDGFGIDLLCGLKIQTSILDALEMVRDKAPGIDLIKPIADDMEIAIRDHLEELGEGSVVVSSVMVWTFMRSCAMASARDERDDARPALMGETIPIADEPPHKILVNDLWSPQEPILVCGAGWLRHVYIRGLYTDTSHAGTYVRSDIQVEVNPERVRAIRADFSLMRLF